VVEYWENFASHAFESTTQSVVSHCVLLKPNGAPVPCTFCFSIRRDIMDLPSIIIGEYFSNLTTKRSCRFLISIHCRPMVAVIVVVTNCLKLPVAFPLGPPHSPHHPSPYIIAALMAQCCVPSTHPRPLHSHNYPPYPLYYTWNDGSSTNTDIHAYVQNHEITSIGCKRGGPAL
jgi:hypothetical protein